MRTANSYDVIIVGGGPAGLNAALVLGRCCRKVLLCDSNRPRNWASKELHSFIALDGMNPRELVQKARAQLAAFDKVCIWDAEVITARRAGDEFAIITSDGRTACSRKLLLATGVSDELPPVPGALEFFGQSLFQCPYCDGWEARSQPTAVYGRGMRGFTMIRALYAWSRDLVLCSDGPAELTPEQKDTLRQHGIRLYEEPIERFEGEKGMIRNILFRSGERISRSYVFYNMPSHQHSNLAEQLGCHFNDNGGVRRGHYEATNIPGLYVAGNMIKDVHLAVVAAAEGARAAIGINKALAQEDFTAPGCLD